MARERRKFDYTAPSYEETVSRAEQKSSGFDNMFKDVTKYNAKVGVNTLRILPPGWKDAKHYGLTIFIHNNVGPKNRRYLCLEQNEGSPNKRCPICEELRKIRNPSAEDTKAYTAQQRVVYYIIDRENEKDGVQLWETSGRNDTEIAAQSLNRRSKSVLNIVHPDNGYDIEFTRQGKTQTNTRYFGFQVMRDDTPLSETEKYYDKWLDEAFEHPIPEILEFYSPETIASHLGGKDVDEDEDERPSRNRDDDDEPVKRTRSSRDEDDEDEPPKKPSRSRLSEDLDDEIPFAGGTRRSKQAVDDEEEEDEAPPKTRSRSTAVEKDEDDDEPPSRGRRKVADEDDDEEAPRTRRKPSAVDDDDEDDEPAPRRPRRAIKDEEDDDSEEDAKEAQKERLRSRLKR